MTRSQAIEAASSSAVKYETPYVVAFDTKEGGFVYSALRAINLVYPNIRSTNYVVLCEQDGSIKEI